MYVFSKSRIMAGLAVICISLGLAGCGERVAIKTGEVAKQLNQNGFSEDIQTTGAFRMDVCWVGSVSCPKVVKLSTARYTQPINFDAVFLAGSNINVNNVQSTVQWRVRSDPKSINQIYSGEIYPEEQSEGTYLPIEKVWKIYGAAQVRSAANDVLKGLTIDEAINTGTDLDNKVLARIREIMKDSPIEIVGYNVTDTDPDPKIMESKQRLFAVEDNKARQIAELKASREIESNRQAVSQKRAENDNAIAAQLGIPVDRFMCLRTLDRLADAADDPGKSIYIGSSCGLGSDANVAPIRGAAK